MSVWMQTLPSPGSINPQSNVSYTTLLAVGPDGECLAVVWQESKPASRAVYLEVLGTDWAGLTWTFQGWAGSGETILFDDFYHLTFDDFK